jgi:hypothetical protein
MNRCTKIHGFVLGEADYWGKVQRVEYECFVAFDSFDDHLGSMDDFFRASGHDMTKHPEIANNWNCARALCFTYFREKREHFSDDGNASISVSRSALPKGPPTRKGPKHSIWINVLNSEEIETPKCAARLLYDQCLGGKISISTAKAIVREHFGDSFPWEEIAAAFEELGGAATDKYVRRK